MSEYDRAVAFVNKYQAAGSPVLGTGAVGNTGGGAKTQNQRDAEATIREFLTRFGLPDSLVQWAFQRIQQNASASEVIMELYGRDEFNQRFPAIKAHRDAGLAPISPEQYINYERTAQELALAAGMPPGFLTKDVTDDLLTKGVSPAELNDRITEGYQAVADADPSVRDAFRQYFGINGDQALAAYFLDPDRMGNVLMEQAKMAGIAGKAHNMLGGWLDKDRTQALVDQGLDADKVHAGFEHLQATFGLFEETISDTEDMSLANQGLAAEFGVEGTPTPPAPATGRPGVITAAGIRETPEQAKNKDQLSVTTGQSALEAKRALEKRGQSRAAAFKGGGDAYQDKSGVTGLGSGSGN